MKRSSIVIGAAALAWVVSGVAAADVIQKWRTPNGTLYFGDRPPAGSTLIETYADSAPPPLTLVSTGDPGLAAAAAEGRDIIRRREADRAAARSEERKIALLEAEERAAEIDEPRWLIVSTSFERPCFFRRPHLGHDHHGRFSDARSPQPPMRFEPRLRRVGVSAESAGSVMFGVQPSSRRTSSIGRSLQ